jgi:MFS family permease
MTNAHPAGGRAGVLGDPYGPRSRFLMYVSGAVVVFACAITATHFGHWRWWLFAWGVLIGVLSAAIYGLLLRLLPALLHASADSTAQLQPRLGQMKRAIYPLMVCLGLGIGILASGAASPWPDILLTGVVIVFQILVPIAMVPMVRRRVRTAASP